MDIHGICALLLRIGNQSLACFLIARLVGVVTYRHAEHITELRPIAHVPTLVEYCREKFCKDTETTLRTDEEHVFKLVNITSVLITLELEEFLLNRVVVLAVY